jgi:hypothetical protein
MRGDPAALVLVPGLILCFAGLNAAPKLPYLKILFHKIKFGWIRTGKKSSVFHATIRGKITGIGGRFFNMGIRGRSVWSGRVRVRRLLRYADAEDDVMPPDEVRTRQARLQVQHQAKQRNRRTEPLLRTGPRGEIPR